MKKSLDQELESAVDDTSEVVEAGNVYEAPRSPAATAPKTKSAVGIGLLAILVAMVLGIVALVMFGFKEAAVYALPANELKARAGELTGRKVRVDGELVPGTLMKRDDPCEYRFTIQANGTELGVQYPQCVVPDTFREGMGITVVVEGRLAADGTFHASEVIPRCPSRYEMDQRAGRGETMPHALPPAPSPTPR